ncbi:MAG: S-layer homology domain-containing protein [Clostridia bacterium]|nr:S-layer homology domain-containing protein [Clostridia bacterium]
MKKSLSLILALLMLTGVFAALPASAAFSDVKADRWSAADISYAFTKGYMNGVGGGKFDPAGTMTRAMVVTVLYRMEGSPEIAFRPDFSDVTDGKWYSSAVIWAKDAGVVLGVSADRFGPDGKITREQLTTMLYRYSSYKNFDLTPSADLSLFPDSGKISAWAAESLSWAVGGGLIKGTNDGRLSPDGKATREQFAAILHRFDDTFSFKYRAPALVSHYTEKDYPLAGDADFYVSTTGSDENDGSFDHPFATFARAVEAVRTLDKTPERGGIKVAFMAGDYGPLAVNLTAGDSGTPECPVVYCKYGDGDVTFNDGKDVPTSDFRPLTEEEKTIFSEKAKDKIYVADVSGKIAGYNVETLVFSDSGEMTVARYPNKYSDNTDNLFKNAAETTGISTMRMLNKLLKDKIATKYHTLEGLKMYGFLTFDWYKETLSIADYNAETGDFYVPDHKRARSADWTGGLRYEEDEEGNVTLVKDDVHLCLLNVSEELDVKGEYWIDTANAKMYVYGEPENYHIMAGTSPMISGSGITNVSFVGLDFYNANEGFISIYGDGITVDGCVFSGCGTEFGVHVEIPENANGGGVALGTAVKNCEISNCAGNGVFIEGCRRGANILKNRSNVTVDNNYFTECNIRQSNTGALRILVSGATVTHNYFYSTSWEGMDYRGTAFLTAEYNVFERICYNGDDTGAVNSYDGEEAEGNVIRNNLFLAGTGGTVGRYCAYLDNSCGTEFCYNLIYDCGIAVMSNGNRNNSVHHNLIVNTVDEDPAGITIKDESTKVVLEAGATGDFSAVTKADNYKRWKDLLQKIETDPEWRAAAEANLPGLLELTYDLDRWAEPEFVLNAANDVYCNAAFSQSGEGFEFKNTVTDYGEYHDNAGYTLEENPIFVNPSTGDYRVRGGVGFDGFEFEKIGRY